MKKINWGKLDHDVWPAPKTAKQKEAYKKAVLKGLEKATKVGVFDYHEKKRRFVVIYD